MNLRIKWLYLAVGTLILLLVGLLYAWSIFRIPLSEMFPEWNATQISTTFTISMLSFCIFGFISGKLSQKIKSSTIIRIATVLLVIGFGVTTLSLDEKFPERSLIMLNIFYGIFCGGGVGLIYNAVIGAVTKWFPDKTGMASGTLLMGFSFGSIILGSVVNVIAKIIGITLTFSIVGIAIAVLVAIGSTFIKSPQYQNPVATSNPESETIEVKNYTISEMIKTPTMWMQFICMTAIGTGGMIIVNSAAVVSVHFGAPAVMGLIFSVFTGVGRVCVGEFFDRFGRVKAVNLTSILMMFSGAILLLGSLFGGIAFIFIGLPILGLAFGGGPPLNIGMTFKFFGAKFFPINCSFMTFILVPSAIVGPIISSRLQDASNGEFDTTFVMIIIMGAIALITGFAVTALAKRDGLIKTNK